jgi:hypothetical protein
MEGPLAIIAVGSMQALGLLLFLRLLYLVEEES